MLAAARIPGAAIAIVSADGSSFIRAYGFRDLDGRESLTVSTPYPIASTTKPMTATMIGSLVDDGLLAWDAPVQAYLPRFRLSDPVRTPLVTLRDLLAMRTGLPRHDWLWVEHEFPRAELVERLPYLELNAGFRERFQYNNLGVTLAGHVAETVTGETWESLLQSRVLDPLGMGATTFVRPEHGATLSYHDRRDGTLMVTEPLASALTGPSGGSIYSNVEDMTKWLAFNLSEGSFAGQQLLKPATFGELRTPQMVVRDGLPDLGWNATYGLCWELFTYNGCSCVGHGGQISDVNSDVLLFPENGLGFVSFTNFGGPRLSRLINEHVFDALTDRASPVGVEQRLDAYAKRIARCSRPQPRVPGTAPSRPVSSLAGQYRHPAYGDLIFTAENGTLRLSRGRLTAALEHRHFDIWSPGANDNHAPDLSHPFEPSACYQFETNEAGQIAAVAIRLEPTVPAIRFFRCGSTA